MYYSKDVIQEVRARNDIVGVISGYVKLTKKGGNYFGCCPFHNEKTPSFCVSPGKQTYHCFGCGVGGNVITFVMEYENQTFPEAVRTLAARAGMELPEEDRSEEERKEEGIRKQLLAANKEAAKYFYFQLKSPSGERAREYFRKRGLTDETIVKFGLGYAQMYRDDLYRYLKKKGFSDTVLSESGLVKISEKGTYDLFWNRAMFPIMDGNRRVIGFGGRVMGEGNPKYLNSPETRLFDKSRSLYGLHLARRSRRPYFLLCEGYMDVISMHQAGFDSAIASLGTAFTSGHASLIRRFAKEVILTYDSDSAGVKAATRAIPMLREAGVSVRVLDLKPYKDPDEFIVHMGAEAFEARIREAVNAFLFESDVLYAQYDMSNPEQKTSFQREIANKLAVFSDSLERENYLQSVAARHGIPADGLREMVRKIGAGLDARPAAEKADGPGAAAAGGRRAKEKKDGLRQTERLLLGWAVSGEGKPERLAEYLSPGDFTDPVCRRLSEILWKAAVRGEKPEAADLLDDMSWDEDMRREAAAVFAMDFEENLSEAERRKILEESVRRIRRQALDTAMRQETDPAKLQKIIALRAKADKEPIRL